MPGHDPVPAGIDRQRFWSGDPGYFRELVGVYGPLVMTVAFAHSLNLDHAEDLYQEIWFRIWERRESYSGIGRFDGWVKRVGTNLCISDHRSQERRKEGMQGFIDQLRSEREGVRCDGALEDIEKEECQVALLRALEDLTERQREAIQLRVFEDLETKEVAREMDVEPATVRSLIRKGVKRLRKVLEDLFE